MPLSTDNKKRAVCDILAVRLHENGATPVIIELKSKRKLKELVAQVNTYAAILDKHRDLVSTLYSVILGAEVGPLLPFEKWIVWPMSNQDPDPQEEALAQNGIRAVGYTQRDGSYDFHVGRSPLC